MQQRNYMSRYDQFIELLDKYTAAVEKRKEKEVEELGIDMFLPFVLSENQAREALIINVIEHYKFN